MIVSSLARASAGNYKGMQFLRPETVRLMHTEAQEQHLEPEPGFVWGLSVKKVEELVFDVFGTK